MDLHRPARKDSEVSQIRPNHSETTQVPPPLESIQIASLMRLSKGRFVTVTPVPVPTSQRNAFGCSGNRPKYPAPPRSQGPESGPTTQVNPCSRIVPMDWTREPDSNRESPALSPAPWRYVFSSHPRFGPGRKAAGAGLTRFWISSADQFVMPPPAWVSLTRLPPPLSANHTWLPSVLCMNQFLSRETGK